MVWMEELSNLTGDKNKVVENVKILFGEEYKEVFIKFQIIIGVND